MLTFDKEAALKEMDIIWLIDNGWTTGGNLAFRHILHEMNNSLPDGGIQTERIEQIIIQYGAENQTEKIKQSLRELIQLKAELSTIRFNRNEN
jgi:hypothetical protein